jgi:hypothetical protein
LRTETKNANASDSEQSYLSENDLSIIIFIYCLSSAAKQGIQKTVFVLFIILQINDAIRYIYIMKMTDEERRIKNRDNSRAWRAKIGKAGVVAYHKAWRDRRGNKVKQIADELRRLLAMVEG